MLITSCAMVPIALRYWRWSAARTALVWGPLTAVNCAFLVASSLKFMEGGFVPLTVGVAAFLVMATWRWGRKATFAAYAARSTMTMADVVALHRSGTTFLERNALIMAPARVRHLADRAPALVGLLWERYGVFPRNLILVEVVHPKVPYIHDHRYHVTVFDRDLIAAASSASNCGSASWKSRMSSCVSKIWRGTGRSTCLVIPASGSSMSRTKTCCPRGG